MGDFRGDESLLGVGSDVSSLPRQQEAEVAQWLVSGARGFVPPPPPARSAVHPAQASSRLGRADLASGASVGAQVTGDDITRLLAEQAPAA